VNEPVPLRLRPLEIGDLLDETFRMYRRHFLLFAGISVILSIPSAALSGYFLSLFNGLLQQSSTGQPPDFSFLAASIPALAAGALIQFLLIPFSYSTVTYAACESAIGRPVTAGSVFMGVLRRYFPLFGYWFLLGLMLIVTLVLCVVPVLLWIWISVLWIAVLPIMFVENVGLGTAMGRSWRLVQGRWWRTFLILFLLLIVSYVVRLALNAFIALGQVLLMIVISSVIVGWIAGATQVIVDSLVNPILQIAIVLIYFDLRVRREALDLFQLAQRVVAPPALS
jgi:hypothetical protein